jgi:spore coat polysaccharide biosynthesis protein SpsF (cytidylyltransferase family)
MKTVAIIAARMNSTRLPGKVMMTLGDVPVLQWVWYAAARASLVNEVCVATTRDKSDDPIVDWCKRYSINWHRGSEDDVLERFTEATKMTKADVVVRLTGDCPFHDPRIIDEVVALRQQTGAAFASNCDPPTYPDGLDTQVMLAEALFAADTYAVRPSDRDTVCEYIGRHRDRWPSATITCPIPGLAAERWVLDTEEDFAFCKAIVSRSKDHPPSMIEILDILHRHPEIRQINSMWKRNERFYAGIAGE